MMEGVAVWKLPMPKMESIFRLLVSSINTRLVMVTRDLIVLYETFMGVPLTVTIMKG